MTRRTHRAADPPDSFESVAARLRSVEDDLGRREIHHVLRVLLVPAAGVGGIGIAALAAEHVETWTGVEIGGTWKAGLLSLGLIGLLLVAGNRILAWYLPPDDDEAIDALAAQRRKLRRARYEAARREGLPLAFLYHPFFAGSRRPLLLILGLVFLLAAAAATEHLWAP